MQSSITIIYSHAKMSKVYSVTSRTYLRRLHTNPDANLLAGLVIRHIISITASGISTTAHTQTMVTILLFTFLSTR